MEAIQRQLLSREILDGARALGELESRIMDLIENERGALRGPGRLNVMLARRHLGVGRIRIEAAWSRIVRHVEREWKGGA